MPDNIGQDFEGKLRKVVETIDVAAVLASPLLVSIKDFLKSSAASMNSDEASVLIRDGESGDLKFLLAIGDVSDQLAEIKIPSGKGIAGFVFSSGQPMTISDADQEESFYAEVDKKTGFSTDVLLATPLQFNGKIIGVLEYINRVGEPPYEPFSPEEMDKAAIYAEAMSSLVNAYEGAKVAWELSNKLISDDNSISLSEVREWLGSLREANDHKEMIDLAVLVREVAMRGEGERKLCREILEAFLKFSPCDISSDLSSL